jgi:hypothetical protein
VAAAKYVESKVDSMKQTKEDELERYRKERESEKRFEKGTKGGKKLVVKKLRKAKPSEPAPALAAAPRGGVMALDEMPPL